MRLLQNLSRHLLSNTRLKRENIHSFADNGELIISGMDMGHGIEVARFKYDAVINLERFHGSGQDIIAIVTGWLIDHDPDREAFKLGDPEFNVEINGNDSADVEIVIEFNESIQIIEDDKGPVQAWGKRWRVSDVPIDTATALVNMEGSSNG